VTRSDAAQQAIVWYDGPRVQLRALFELADDSAEQIDSYIALGRVLVALDDASEIVGHAQLVPTGIAGTVELKSIAVLPGSRRRGIGRALVERALASCRDEGVRAVTVTTSTADIDNIRFYQRRGFRAASIEQDVFTEAKGYPPGLEADGIPARDGITFRLDLDQGPETLSRQTGGAQHRLQALRTTEHTEGRRS
jgi:ribosomal protein S18 acetylase RimI-like enzyme